MKMKTAENSEPTPRPPARWEQFLLGMRWDELPRVFPGLAAAFALAWLAQILATRAGAWVLAWQGVDPVGRASPVSSISVAVVLGLVLSNATRLPGLLRPGIDFARNKILRLGIILVGIKLSVIDVLKVGLLGVPLVMILVAFALFASLWLARRMDVSSQLGSLAAASTAICGITATLAVAPVVEADEKEVAYTVANVTLFGLLGMLVYPYLAHAFFGELPGAAGLFLGTAIHDTSQVMGAAISYREVFGDERALQVATVAKLTRNSLLVAVIPLLAWLHARKGARRAGEKRSLASFFPVFIFGFLALSLLRTAGDVGLEGGGLALGIFTEAAWGEWGRLLGERISSFALGAALAAVGMSTRLSVLRGLGPRPFVVGFSAATLVGLVSLVLSALVGPLL